MLVQASCSRVWSIYFVLVQTGLSKEAYELFSNVYCNALYSISSSFSFVDVRSVGCLVAQ